jgi:uncharacterized protein with HEPN domain
MSKDPKILARHILESIEFIEDFSKNITQAEFLKSVKTQDAIIRRLEIIGEAAGNFPEDFRKKYPEIRWEEISGMRNVLVHEYFRVDLDLIWKTVEKDVPKLKKQILKITKI